MVEIKFQSQFTRKLFWIFIRFLFPRFMHSINKKEIYIKDRTEDWLYLLKHWILITLNKLILVKISIGKALDLNGDIILELWVMMADNY